MNKKILLLIVLLLVPIVSAVNINEDHELSVINRCYGNVEVKVRSIYNEMENDYYLVDCNRANTTSWTCVCNTNGKTSIWFVSHTESIYDIVIEYYIEPVTHNERIDSNNRRTLNFNDLNFGKDKTRTPFVMPTIKQANIIFVVVFIIVAGLSFLVYLIVKKVITSEDNLIDESEKEKRRKEKEKLKDELKGLETYR